MEHQFKPYDVGIWLDMLDVNCLTDAEADQLYEMNIDIENDADLDRMITEWMKPRFVENNAQTRASMLKVLEKSRQWTAKQLQPFFAMAGLPSRQEIKDIDRFMEHLRRQILG